MTAAKAKPTYEELEQHVIALEEELLCFKGTEHILSEVFIALQEIASGNPYVRIPEGSPSELMETLRRHVNRTAENLEEIVNLSHEFAIGLAEHFDVLLRVSDGNLDARVTGTSSVELLDALKRLTNKTIESVSEEIKKRKQTETTLATERERLFSLLDALPMYVYLQAPDHSIRFANRCFKEHFGEPGGRLCYEVIGETDRPCSTCRPFSVLKTGIPVVWEWARKNGKTYEIFDYPFIDNDGSALVLELGIDITKRKEAEREKQEMEAQFHQAQKMEALGVLAGSIVHDFNNLLMVIQSDATMMLREIGPEHPNHEKLKSIQQEVRNGARILEEMLGFARSGKSAAIDTDLNTIVEKNCNLFGRSKPEVQIQSAFQKDLWKAEVDPVKIDQVLLNLLINASDAMPEGGKLEIETKNEVLKEKDVAIHHTRPGAYVRIRVKDHGSGMDKETKQRAFEPFFTTKKEGRGTGLGLTSVYGIIKSHGGFVAMKSKTGKGTTFDVYLPARKAEKAE